MGLGKLDEEVRERIPVYIFPFKRVHDPERDDGWIGGRGSQLPDAQRKFLLILGTEYEEINKIAEIIHTYIHIKSGKE